MTLQQWFFVCFASVLFAKVNTVYYENEATSELGKTNAKKASRLLWMPSVLERHRQLTFCGNNEYEKVNLLFQPYVLLVYITELQLVVCVLCMSYGLAE